MNKFNKVVKSVRTKVNKKIIVLASKLSATFVRTDFVAFVALIMYRSAHAKSKNGMHVEPISELFIEVFVSKKFL